MSGAWSFAFWCISNIEHLFHHARPEHSKTPLHTSKPHKHTYTSPICSQSPPPGISGQFRTRTDTNRNQQTGTPKGCSRMCGGSCSHWIAFLVSVGAFWCLTASFSVPCCLELWEGCLRSLSKGIWELFMDLFKVWVPTREHLSVQAIFGAACFVLENLERQNSTHLAFFKHQNTKTSLCKLPKNHWVFTLLEILGSVRRKLQSTVSLDHPVFDYKV